MITNRSIPRDVQVNVVSCDGPDCEQFAELDRLGRVPHGWLCLSTRDFEDSGGARDFCSLQCLEDWATLEKMASASVGDAPNTEVPDESV